MLLKINHGDDGKDEEGGGAAAKIGHTEFISHTVWAHKLDFDDWRKRCVFRKLPSLSNTHREITPHFFFDLDKLYAELGPIQHTGVG